MALVIISSNEQRYSSLWFEGAGSNFQLEVLGRTAAQAPRKQWEQYWLRCFDLCSDHIQQLRVKYVSYLPHSLFGVIINFRDEGHVLPRSKLESRRV